MSVAETNDKSKRHTDKSFINRGVRRGREGWLKRRENVQEWNGKIKGGGCQLLSHSRGTTPLLPPWVACICLANQESWGGGHTERVKMKGLNRGKKSADINTALCFCCVSHTRSVFSRPCSSLMLASLRLFFSFY